MKGVSIAATVFFTVWGIWNLYYYSHLDQKYSCYASLGLVLANGAWLAIYINHNGIY